MIDHPCFWCFYKDDDQCLQNQTMTEREKFSKLVRESHAELLVYARSLTREDTDSRDIVQDSFVVAWNNMNKF